MDVKLPWRWQQLLIGIVTLFSGYIGRILSIDTGASGYDTNCVPTPPEGCTYSEKDGIPTANCSNIAITTIPKCLPGNKHPTKVIITGNNITQVNAIYFDFVEYLSLDNNGIEIITKHAFNRLGKLKYLSLTQNKIKDITKDTFSGLVNLRTLNLSFNAIEILPKEAFSYKYLTSLKFLRVDSNLISHIDNEAFTYLRNLSILNLRRNKLIQVPKFDKTGLDLDELDLGHNHLTEIPHQPFTEFVYLRSLHLDNNQILTLPHSAFWNLKHLKILRLDQNKLQMLWYHLFLDTMDNLREVYLHDNDLLGLDPSILKWDTLDILTLDNNSWQCNCHITWMQSLKFVVKNMTIVRCREPQALYGQDVRAVTLDQLHCPHSVISVVGITLGVIVSLILLAGLGFVLHRYIRRKAAAGKNGNVSPYRRMGGRHDNSRRSNPPTTNTIVQDGSDDEL